MSSSSVSSLEQGDMHVAAGQACVGAFPSSGGPAVVPADLPSALLARLSTHDLLRIIDGLNSATRTVVHNEKMLSALAAHRHAPHCRLVDNALAAELLSSPEVAGERPGVAGKFLEFVAELGDRDAALGETAADVQIASDDPCAFDIRTAFYHFKGDLSCGKLVQTPADGHGHLIVHSGNLFEFRCQGRTLTLDAEDAIQDYGIIHDSRGVVLWHAGPLFAATGFLSRAVRRLGVLEIRYEIVPSSPILTVTVRFRAERTLRRARVTTALDLLDEGPLGEATVRVRRDQGWQVPAPAGNLLAAAATRRAVIRGVVIEGHASAGGVGVAAHLRPTGKVPVLSVTGSLRRDGALRWLLLRYGPRTLWAGRELVAREERVLICDAAGHPSAAPFSDTGAGDGATSVVSARRLAVVAASQALAWQERDAAAPRLSDSVRESAIRWIERQVILHTMPGAGAGDLACAALAVDALSNHEHTNRLPTAGDLVSRLLGMLGAADSPGLGDRPRSFDDPLILLALARLTHRHTHARHTLESGLRRFEHWPEDYGFPERSALAARDAAGIALLARAAGAVGLLGHHGVVLDAASLRTADRLYRSTVNVLRRGLRHSNGTVEADLGYGADTGLLAGIALAVLLPERHNKGQPFMSERVGSG